MICRHVASPRKSASSSGPIGWFIPSFITASIASFVATPSWRANTASLIIGIRIRFETNPGKSWTSTGVFPSRSHSSRHAFRVASLVWRPRTTSTSFITGTGLKKWRPMNRSGLARPAGGRPSPSPSPPPARGPGRSRRGPSRGSGPRRPATPARTQRGPRPGRSPPPSDPLRGRRSSGWAWRAGRKRPVFDLAGRGSRCGDRGNPLPRGGHLRDDRPVRTVVEVREPDEPGSLDDADQGDPVQDPEDGRRPDGLGSKSGREVPEREEGRKNNKAPEEDPRPRDLPPHGGREEVPDLEGDGRDKEFRREGREPDEDDRHRTQGVQIPTIQELGIRGRHEGHEHDDVRRGGEPEQDVRKDDGTAMGGREGMAVDENQDRTEREQRSSEDRYVRDP